jgi:hypothetical protein
VTWFRYVRPHQVDIDAGRGDAIYRDEVAPTLDQHISRPPFERACRAWVREHLGRDRRLPDGGSVGAWWGQVPAPQDGPRKTRAAEAEIVVRTGDRVTLVGEVKWSQTPVGPRALDQVLAVLPGIPGADRQSTCLVLFSRSGFTDALRALADDRSVVLVTLDEMYAG